MSQRKPRPTRRGDEYNEVAYRESLRTLGLFVPAPLDEVQQAYRSRVKLFHPDRLAGNGNADEATRRIQNLNVAHEYIVRHYAAFERAHGRAWRRAGRPLGESARSSSTCTDFLLAPITIVYSAALLMAALAAAPLAPLGRRAEEKGGVSRWLGVAWATWLAVGPYVTLSAAFVVLEGRRIGPTWIKWWLGGSFLIMISADLASRITGESNPLRQHWAVQRLHALVRGY